MTDATTLRELIEARAVGTPLSWACRLVAADKHDSASCVWCKAAFIADVTSIACANERPIGLRLYDAVLRRCIAEQLGFKVSLSLAHEIMATNAPSQKPGQPDGG